MAYPLESSLQTVKTNFSEVTLTCGFNVLDTSLDKHRNWLLRSHHSCQGHPKIVTLPGRLCDGWPGFGLWFLSRREGEKSTKTKWVSTHNSNISKASRGELTVVWKLLEKKTSSRIERLTYSSHFSKYHTDAGKLPGSHTLSVKLHYQNKGVYKEPGHVYLITMRGLANILYQACNGVNRKYSKHSTQIIDTIRSKDG